MLRQRDNHNSALNDQYKQQLPLKVGHQEEQVAKLEVDFREKEEHLKRESKWQNRWQKLNIWKRKNHWNFKI